MPDTFVLVVDDNPEMLNFPARAPRLKDSRSARSTASSRPWRRCTTERPRPAVIVTDLMMPRTTGWDFLKHLRSETSLEGLPVIVITGADPGEGEGMANLVLQADRSGAPGRNGPLDDAAAVFVEDRVSRLLTAILCVSALAASTHAQTGTYQELVALFEEFAAFERPALKDGAPDYTAATLAAKRSRLRTFQSRLTAIDPKAWPVDQQVVLTLRLCLDDGLEFNLRVLQPWARDPAALQVLWTQMSDTPAHEGPTHHAVVEV